MTVTREVLEMSVSIMERCNANVGGVLEMSVTIMERCNANVGGVKGCGEV